MNKALATLILGGMAMTSAHAIPLLQLDIGGGVYNTSHESIVTTSDSFSVFALFDSSQNKSPGLNNYILSAAITPHGTHLTENFGSFSLTIGGVTTVFNAANMAYGRPPLDAGDIDLSEDLNGDDPVDQNGNTQLAKHDIFETSYSTIQFNFLAGINTTSYNTQDDPGGPTEPATGPLLYREIIVNAAGLNPGFNLHFDLFHTNSSGKIDAFAPFSHDAESDIVRTPPPNNVPEGGSTLVLLSAGLFGLAYARRRFAK